MFQPYQFGRYLLEKKLATGGMAEIFQGKLIGAEGFEKDIVIKKILPQWSSDKEFIRMLIDEAKISVQLNHANIIQVYELGREAEDFYIAMEYVHGVDLRRMMQRSSESGRKISLEASLLLILEILEGLSYAHHKKDAQGKPLRIIHRDISPQNILISFDGTVKITDFGIAKAALSTQETMTGVLKGKFAYMSPEQANQEVIDARSDLYSAAVVFYELLTGRRLFEKGSDIEILDRVRRGQIRLSPEAEEQIPETLRKILQKGLAARKEARYEDASAFREALLTFSQESGLSLRREKLSSAIAELFKEGEPAAKSEETLALVKKTVLKASDRTWRRWATRSALGAVLLASSSWALITWKTTWKTTWNKKPEVSERLIEKQSIAEAQKSQTVMGYLSVQAIPWGLVTIDQSRSRETPLKKLPVGAGPHVVRVSYEPEKISLSANITVKPSEEIVCIANFRDKKGIRCGP